MLQSSYKLRQLLGSGAYGRVFKGTASDGTSVALKEIVLETQGEGVPPSTLRELSVLRKFQSYNCCHLVNKIGFPKESEWPSVSYFNRAYFNNPKIKPTLRSEINTTDVEALDLIEKLLEFNPRRRITARQALSLPYFHPRPNTFPGLPFETNINGTLAHTSSTTAASLPPVDYNPHTLHHNLQPNGHLSHGPLNRERIRCTSTSETVLKEHLEVRQNNDVQSKSSLNAPDITVTSNGNSNSEPVTDAQPTSPPPIEPKTRRPSLVLSVIQNATEQKSPATSTDSMTAVKVPASSNVTATPPRRPVTRQQTKISRRYTQPTIPTTIMPSGILERALSSLEEKDELSLPAKATKMSNGRPKKTARRRTITCTSRRKSGRSTGVSCASITTSIRTDPQFTRKTDRATGRSRRSSNSTDHQSEKAYQTFSESGSLDESSDNLTALCSPSKLPRVSSLKSSHSTKSLSPSTYTSLANTEEEEEEENEEVDTEGTEDSEDYHAQANTSLGINSAMTGLALVSNGLANSTATTTPSGAVNETFTDSTITG